MQIDFETLNPTRTSDRSVKNPVRNYIRRRHLLRSGITAFAIFLYTGHVLASAGTITTQSDQTGLALSVYQHNLGLVKDSRDVTLTPGQNTLSWRDIAAGIKTETAWLKYAQHAQPLQVRAQYFDLNRLTPQQLLDSYVGKTIGVMRTHPVSGDEIHESATVLSTNGGIILQFADRIETGVPGRLAFPSLPPDLSDKTVMHIVLDHSAEQTSQQTTQPTAPHGLELTYLTHGLSWRADYILELDPTEQHAALTGFAELTNQSGIDYHHAAIQLIAGNVNQTSPGRASAAAKMLRQDIAREMEMMSAAVADVQTEAHFELHRYTLPQPITLRDKQAKQVAFLSAGNIALEKQFVLHGQNHYYTRFYQLPEQKQNANVWLNFDNTGDGLGKPLPGGIVRVYQPDRNGSTHFIGEDAINHTANKARVRLKVGQAFDIFAEKKQTDFRKIPSSDPNVRQFETTHHITVHNAKKEPVTVVIREPIPGDWSILSESHVHKKITSNLAEWHIEVAGEDRVELTYRVRATL